MIIQQSVSVKYSNNKKYYISKGYPDLKQGSTVDINVEDLPINSNKEVLCECNHCGKHFNRSFQIAKKSLNKIGKILCYNCSRKNVGKTMNISNMILSNKKRCGKRHPRYNPNKNEFKIYANEVNKITKRQPLDLLENYDKPRTLCGVEGGYQLDHVVSIKEGFEKDIPAKYIGSLVNLRFIPWEENRKKSYNSDGSIQVNRIKRI